MDLFDLTLKILECALNLSLGSHWTKPQLLVHLILPLLARMVEDRSDYMRAERLGEPLCISITLSFFYLSRSGLILSVDAVF